MMKTEYDINREHAQKLSELMLNNPTKEMYYSPWVGGGKEDHIGLIWNEVI